MEHLRLWLKERPGIPWEISWVVLLAAALRVVAFWRYDPVAFDSAIYFEMADHIRAGHWSTVLTYDYPPLYPFLVAAVQWFLRNPEIAGVLVSFTADVFVILPLFAIARTAVGYAGAWGAVFLWAIHPLAISLGVQALSDAPTAALVAVSIWAGLHALEHRRLAWALAAGIASGLAHMTRPEGIEPALVLAALCCWPVNKLGAPPSASPKIQSTWGSGNQTLLRPTLRNAAWVVAPLVGWALVASPYIIAISEQTGTLTLSKKKSAAGFVRSLAGEGTLTIPPQNPALLPSNENAPDQLTTSAPAAPQSRLNRLITGIYVFQKPLINSIHPVIWILILIAAWNSRVVAMEGTRFARTLLLTLVGLHFAVLIGLAADHGATYLGGHHFFLMVLYSLPFAVQPFAAAFDQVDRRLIETSWTLGVSRAGTFFKLILPMSVAGMVTGFVLSFAHTLGEFGVVLMVGGNLPGVTRTVSISIYDAVQALDYRAAARTSLLLLVICIVRVPASLKNLRGAFLLVAPAWLALNIVHVYYDKGFGRMDLLMAGNDWWSFQAYAYRIYMQGYWLEGGETVEPGIQGDKAAGSVQRCASRAIAPIR